MSRDQNAGQNFGMKIGNKSLERVEQFRGLGKTLKIKITFMKKLRTD